MVEGGGNELEDAVVLKALETAKVEIDKLCRLQLALREKVGQPKLEIAKCEIPADIAKAGEDTVRPQVIKVLEGFLDKQSRDKAIKEIKKALEAQFITAMLFLAIDAQKPSRIQGAYVSEEEITRVADFLRAQGRPEYPIQLPEDKPTGMTGWPNAGGDEEEQSAAEPAPLEMIQNPVPAGFWVRGGAYFIDIAFYTAAGFLFLVPVAQGKHTTTSSLFSALFAVVLNIALTASGGQTLGKFLAGIEVRTADGRDVGVVRSAVRYFSTWLDYITLLVGFIIAAFTGRKRSLHDYIAGTVVVYRGRPSIMRQLCMWLCQPKVHSPRRAVRD